MPTALARGVYWVGAIDWNLRDFHGYSTHRGTTYNAYLVVDEKVALIDTVKAPFAGEMMARIREIIDPSRIDYVISNHVEMDHSGALPVIMQAAPRAKLFTTERFGEQGLKKCYQAEWPLTPVKEGSELSLGQRKIVFIPIPMLHWPDSMCSYLAEEQILFPNDGFGQHLASFGRFDDEEDPSVVMWEAQKYYANILMPMGQLVLKAIDKLKPVPIRMIAPSHGIIWRSRVADIVGAWARWASGGGEKRAVIAYETMWGSTEKMARAIAEGLESRGVRYSYYDLAKSDRSDVVADILTAKALLVGSATMNNQLLPRVSGLLSYLKGLKPAGKLGAAFGSFGWAGGAVKAVEAEMLATGVTLAANGLGLRFVPDPAELEQCRDLGRVIGDKLKTS
jgi:flavorubredoxin